MALGSVILSAVMVIVFFVLHRVFPDRVPMDLPVVIGAVDGVNNGFAFGEFFLRFGLMVILLKAYDIFFFDWILLCNSGFFPHYYPETKELIGHQLFGYNMVSHAIHTAVYLAFAAGLSWVLS